MDHDNKAEAVLARPLVAGGVVRVNVPADVAYDLQKHAKVTENVLARLGCRGCHSGYDIRFIYERDFAVNPVTLDVHAVTKFGG